MFQIIALLIFLVSLIGLGVIIFRKIPVLATLAPKEFKAKPLEEIKKKIKRNSSYSLRKLLEKTLSGFRIFTLKTENKTSHLLKKLRKKSLEDKDRFSEDYWTKIKRKR